MKDITKRDPYYRIECIRHGVQPQYLRWRATYKGECLKVTDTKAEALAECEAHSIFGKEKTP